MFRPIGDLNKFIPIHYADIGLLIRTWNIFIPIYFSNNLIR